MTRALGTALGVALVTLTLHLTRRTDPALGGHVAATLLAILALGVLISSLISPHTPHHHERVTPVDL